jgi:hypothetical protein
MIGILPADIWYVIATILSPPGFVIQDVVADAMTVEAVPLRNEDGSPVLEDTLQRMHITLQTPGRIAIVGGVARSGAPFFREAHYLLYTRWFPTAPKMHTMIYEYSIQMTRPSSDDSINLYASLVARHS